MGPSLWRENVHGEYVCKLADCWRLEKWLPPFVCNLKRVAGHRAGAAHLQNINSSREHLGLLSQHIGHALEQAQVHHDPCVLQAGAEGFIT